MTLLSQGARVLYRKGSADHRNFGDYLSRMLLDRALLNPALRASRYRLIGSIIDDQNIEADLKGIDDGGKIVYWGCGARDAAPPRADLLERCVFLGARGPLTRDLLGLPAETTLGDTGLLAPLMHPAAPPDRRHGRMICVPHFFEPRSDDELLELTGADAVIRPNIESSLECLEAVLDQISGAAFVLAGALHAAIVAHAYGVPFAFFDSGYLDAPFKWRDFSASIGISAAFVNNVADGLTIYDNALRKRAKKLPLLPILANAPFQVKPSILLAAAEYDGLASVPPALIEALQRSPIESQARLRAVHQSECERDDLRRAHVAGSVETAVRAQAGDLAANVREKQARLVEAESRLGDFTRELDKLRAANEDLGRRLSIAEACLDQSRLAQTAADACHQVEVSRLEALRGQSEEALAEMVEALANAESAARKSSASVVALNAALGAAASDCARLEREAWRTVGAARDVAGQRDEATRTVARLEGELQRSEMARYALIETNGTLRTRIAELEDQLQSTGRAVEALRSAQAAALSRLAEAEEQREAADRAIDTMREAHAAENLRQETVVRELTAALEAASLREDRASGDLKATSLKAEKAVRDARAAEARLRLATEAHDGLVTQLLSDLSAAAKEREVRDLESATLRRSLDQARRQGGAAETRARALATEVEGFKRSESEWRFDARLAVAAQVSSGSWLGGVVMQAWLLGARLAARRRQWRAAERLYGRILMAKPSRPRIAVQYGHSLKERGERALAAVAYGRALRLDPRDRDAANHLCHLLNDLGRRGEADAVEEAFKPADVLAAPPSPTGDGDQPASLGPWRRVQAFTASRAMRSGDWAKSATRLEALVRISPGHAESWMRLGQVRAARDDLKGAWYAYAEALRLDPRRALAYRGLAAVLRRLDESDLADLAEIRAFQLTPGDSAGREALRARGWSPDALVGLVSSAPIRPLAANAPPVAAIPAILGARWAVWRRDWKRAALHYRALTGSAPAYGPVWVQLGDALRQGGDLDGAEVAYLQALALAPDDACVHLRLGHALKLMGRVDQALDAYRRAQDLRPTWDEARLEAASLEGLRREAAEAAGPRAPPASRQSADEAFAADGAISDKDREVSAPADTALAPPSRLTSREAAYWPNLRRAIGATAKT